MSDDKKDTAMALPEYVEDDGIKSENQDPGTTRTVAGTSAGVNDQRNNALYREALARYPNDAAIDPARNDDCCHAVAATATSAQA